MNIFQLFQFFLLLCCVNGHLFINETGLKLEVEYSSLLYENQKVNVECFYTGSAPQYITWRIFDPETKLEPYIFHGPNAMIAETKENVTDHLAFVFVARRDLQDFGVECAIKSLNLSVVYRIPRIQQPSVRLAHCERVHLVKDRVNEVMCYLEGISYSEDVTLIYRGQTSEMKNLTVKRIEKMKTFKEILYIFTITDVVKAMNNMPYQSVAKTLGSNGKNLTIFSKVKGFFLHFMEFVMVPDQGYGAINSSTVVSIRVSVNPFPKVSDFEIVENNAEKDAFRPSKLEIKASNEYTHDIDLHFPIVNSGNYSLYFTDSVMPSVRERSKLFRIELLLLRTPEESLKQSVMLNDQVELLMILESEVVPTANNLFFYREIPGEAKDERVKEKYVTYTMDTLQGNCKITVALILKKSGIYRFELIIDGSRVIGPQFDFKVMKDDGGKEVDTTTFNLVLMLSLLVPMGSFLLSFLALLAARKLWKTFMRADSAETK